MVRFRIKLKRLRCLKYLHNILKGKLWDKMSIIVKTAYRRIMKNCKYIGNKCLRWFLCKKNNNNNLYRLNEWPQWRGAWGSLMCDSQLAGLISSIVSCNSISEEWGGETRKQIGFYKEWEVAGKTQDMIPKRGGFYSSWKESQWSRRDHERCRGNPNSPQTMDSGHYSLEMCGKQCPQTKVRFPWWSSG